MAHTRQELLEILRTAVEEAGGIPEVAEAIRTRPSHLWNVVTGHRNLGRDTASRLRSVKPCGKAIVELPSEIWVELLAPAQVHQ